MYSRSGTCQRETAQSRRSLVGFSASEKPYVAQSLYGDSSEHQGYHQHVSFGLRQVAVQHNTPASQDESSRQTSNYGTSSEPQFTCKFQFLISSSSYRSHSILTAQTRTQKPRLIPMPLPTPPDTALSFVAVYYPNEGLSSYRTKEHLHFSNAPVLPRFPSDSPTSSASSESHRDDSQVLFASSLRTWAPTPPLTLQPPPRARRTSATALPNSRNARIFESSFRLIFREPGVLHADTGARCTFVDFLSTRVRTPKWDASRFPAEDFEQDWDCDTTCSNIVEDEGFFEGGDDADWRAPSDVRVILEPESDVSSNPMVRSNTILHSPYSLLPCFLETESVLHNSHQRVASPSRPRQLQNIFTLTSSSNSVRVTVMAQRSQSPSRPRSRPGGAHLIRHRSVQSRCIPRWTNTAPRIDTRRSTPNLTCPKKDPERWTRSRSSRAFEVGVVDLHSC